MPRRPRHRDAAADPGVFEAVEVKRRRDRTDHVRRLALAEIETLCHQIDSCAARRCDPGLAAPELTRSPFS
jgi:hypothetical protein